ncbi:hypothetical protein GALMADRAFT_244181 [Galerina marginata CBS 339.88]|uniref:Uncharacterized protein n=1 Tax=Galerina marginata (strain CBS 339.88) TaxID=685588 RepID=A0A067TI75_GALM3|nr:hypothetical protein GALMADRAFT_244181 [Galerina marginata CBS 339.88]
MSSSTPRFLTSRSDYNDIVLFRHIRQSLAAAQTETVEAFCTVAASKPGSEFHYLGLLWNCAFKAGIASTGAHLEPTTLPSPLVPPSSSPTMATTLLPVVAATLAPKISPSLSAFTRDFSALRSNSQKPFGSLQYRFRRCSGPKNRLPALIAPRQITQSVCLPLESTQSHSTAVPPPEPSSPAHIISPHPPHPICVPSLQIPIHCDPETPPPPTAFAFPSRSSCDTTPSTINTSTTRYLRTFVPRLSWPSRKPKLLRWLRAPLTLQPKGLQASLLRP